MSTRERRKDAQEYSPQQESIATMWHTRTGRWKNPHPERTTVRLDGRGAPLHSELPPPLHRPISGCPVVLLDHLAVSKVSPSQPTRTMPVTTRHRHRRTNSLSVSPGQTSLADNTALRVHRWGHLAPVRRLYPRPATASRAGGAPSSEHI